MCTLWLGLRPFKGSTQPSAWLLSRGRIFCEAAARSKAADWAVKKREERLRGRHLALPFLSAMFWNDRRRTINKSCQCAFIMGNILQNRIKNHDRERRRAELSRSISLYVNKQLSLHRQHQRRRGLRGLPTTVGSLFAGINTTSFSSPNTLNHSFIYCNDWLINGFGLEKNCDFVQWTGAFWTMDFLRQLIYSSRELAPCPLYLHSLKANGWLTSFLSPCSKVKNIYIIFMKSKPQKIGHFSMLVKVLD